MTVKELRAFLAELPDDAPVVAVSGDPEDAYFVRPRYERQHVNGEYVSSACRKRPNKPDCPLCRGVVVMN